MMLDCRAAPAEHQLADGFPHPLLVCHHHHLHCGARHQVLEAGQGYRLWRLGACHGGQTPFSPLLSPLLTLC